MADKVFNIKFNVDGNVGPLKSALDGLKGSFEKLKLPDNLGKNFISTFDKLENEVKNFEAITSKGFQNMGDIGKAEKSYEKITTLFSQLQQEVAHIKGVDPNKLLPPEALERTKQLKTAWEGLLKAQQQDINIKAKLSEQNGELEKQRQLLKEIESLSERENKLTNLERNRRSRITAERNKGYDISEISPQLVADLAKFRTELAEIQARKQEIFNNLNVSSWAQGTELLSNNINKTTKEIDKLKNSMEQVPGATQKVRELLAQFKYGGDISKVSTDIKEIGRDISTLNSAAIEEINTRISNLSNNSAKAKTALDPIGPAMRRAADDGGALNERARDLQRLADQAKYFFSITNSIQLFKRTVRSAFNTIKDLDESMTQAAVVTQYDVSDMWSMLPQYAKRADALGVSLKGAYDATTLYLQQGLELNQAIEIGDETLKMAKIAGMDYATATDYMTSALRGFNMELNETSAQRVNDVYSELAARSASNTEELSIAMSKTAPLAHNAGMEIESTSAILANMIEKTREAPETLGTAMKTVIARFQELKKAPDQIGEVDGEIVDANKIETALRSIGVALRDSQGQFRDFDDVIFDISAKWDSLDKNTQRYIATIAAGSRQQSRFIAMVSDYDRTMELVNMANNSAGASAEQFAKTQDSLASKMERLKTAWAEFTMGIANNQIIKAAIDALTGLINMINKLTSGLSGQGAGGVLKSIINTAELIAGIKIARAALNGFFAFILKTSKTTGVAAGANIGTGMAAGLKSASFGDKLATILTPVASTKAAMFSKGIGKQFAAEVATIKVAKDNILNNHATALGNNPLRGVGSGSAGLYSNRMNTAMGMASYSNAAAAATVRAKSLDQLFASYSKLTAGIELNAEQEKIAESFRAKGISQDRAKMMALSGMTAATREDTTTTLENTFAKKANAQAELMSMKGRMRNNAALVFGTKEMRKQAQANRVLAGTQTNLSGALAKLPISLGAILGIIAAIAAIIAVIHHFSLGQQIKRAQKATQEASEAAQEAQKAYDDLLNARETYNGLQDKLSELTYGTKEFTQALLEANAQVLELMQQYEGLEVTTGEHGQLKITDESWEKVTEQQSNLAMTKQNQFFASKINEIDLQQKKAEKDLRSALSSTSDYSNMTPRSQKDVNAILENVNPENVHKVALDYQLTEKQEKALSDYVTNSFTNSQTKKGYIQSMTAGLLSEDVRNSENAKQVGSILASQYQKDLDYAKEYAKGLFSRAAGGDRAAKLEKDQIKQDYSNLTGVSVDNLKDSADALTEYYLALFDTGEYKEKSEDISSAIDKYKDSLGGLIDGLSGEMSDDFETFFKDNGFDLSEVANLEDDVFKGKIEDALEDAGVDLENLARDFGFVFEDGQADVESFLNTLKTGAAEAEQAWQSTQQETTNRLKEIGYSNEEAKNQFAVGNTNDQKIISGIFNNAYENLGKNSSIVQNMATLFPKLLKEGMSGESIQDIFGNIDFSSSAAAFNDIEEALSKIQDKSSTAYKELSRWKTFSEFRPAEMFKDFAHVSLDEIADDLKEIADEDGNITGEGIERLAKTVPTLNELLQTGKITADQAAIALSMIGKGTSINVFTDAVLNAIGKIKTLKSVSQGVFDYINNWDEGTNEDDATDFFKERGKALKEQLDNGQLQGDSFEKNVEALSAKSIRQLRDEAASEYDYQQQLYKIAAEPDKLYKKMSKNSGVDFMTDVLGFKFDENGQIIQESVKTTDEILEAIKATAREDGVEISDELAEGLLTEWQTGLSLNITDAIEIANITPGLSSLNLNPEEVISTGPDGIGVNLTEDQIDMVLRLHPEFQSKDELIKYIESLYPDGVKVTVTPEEDYEGKGTDSSWGEGGHGRRTSNQDRRTSNQDKPKPTVGGSGRRGNENIPKENVAIGEETEKAAGKVNTSSASIIKDFLGIGKATKEVGETTTTELPKIFTWWNKTAQNVAETKGSFDEANQAADGVSSGADNASASLSGTATAAASTMASLVGLKQEEAGIGETAQEGAENAASAYEQLDAETQAAIAKQQAIANAMNNAGSAAVKAAAKISLLALAIRALKSKAITISVNIKASASIDTGGIASKIGSAISSALSILPPSIRAFLGLKTGTKLSRSNIVSAASTPSKFMTAASGVYGGLRKNQLALTGELGPELAWDDEGAFLLGSNGPEVAYLKKGTVIYNDKDTKKILGSNSFKGRIKNYRLGNGPDIIPSGSGTPRRTTSSSSNASRQTGTPDSKSITSSTKEANKETEKWENSLDIIYNLLEKINQEARHREKLEKQYQRLLKKRGVTSKELINLSKQQLASLEIQKADELERIKRREQEMKDLIEKNKDLSEYIKYNWDTDTIEVDYDKVNAIKDKDKGDSFDKFKEEMERIRDDMRESEDTLEDIEDETWEIQERGREEATKLEERALEAIIKLREEEIEKMEEQNKIIDEANSSLLDAIDSNISQMRKDREREKTVNDLEEKQRRLAYLRQDTTGGNAVEIKRLEKELADAKQDYTDTLVDDRLSELKDLNEEAKKQREKQIELLTAQLDYMKETGTVSYTFKDEQGNAKTVTAEGLAREATDKSIAGESVINTDLYKLLYKAEGVEEKTSLNKTDWTSALLGNIATAGIFTQTPAGLIEAMRASAEKGNKETFTNIEAFRNTKVEEGTGFIKAYNNGLSGNPDVSTPGEGYMAKINELLGKASEQTSDAQWAEIFKLAGLRDAKIERIKAEGLSIPYENIPNTIEYVLKEWAKKYKFKKGGLVNKTGPAWLDGTKTRPEMVLNAQQTAAFIQLKDILSQLNLSGSAPTSDNYNFDIDIHVDQISNDYDVDRMAEQLERSLYEKAMYRNVNSLRFMK